MPVNPKKRTLLFSFLLLMISTGVMAQQQIYSYNQYADNLTPINPAYSLLDKAGSLSVIGRRQFVGINGAPTSLLLSGSLPVPSVGGAAGIYVLSDKIAVENQIEVNAFFAKGIQLAENSFLGVSLNAGVRNYNANYSILDPNGSDQEFDEDVRETRPNIGFGVMYYTPKYYIGVSVPELSIRSLGTASIQQANFLRNHYYFAAAYLADAGEDIKFKPAALVSYVKGSDVVADISGTFYLKEQLGLGVNYKTTKKVAGIISVTTDTFKVGYAYQFGVSNNLGGINTAIHEVTLSYRFGATAERKLL